MTQFLQLDKTIKALKTAEEKVGQQLGQDGVETNPELYAIYDELCKLTAKAWNLRAGKLRAAHEVKTALMPAAVAGQTLPAEAKEVL